MLNRRHIREKVLKGLYAFFQSNSTDVIAGEKELFLSIDKVYELYLYYLNFAISLKDFVAEFIEERKQKHLPTKEDLNPKLNFINNRLIQAMEGSSELHDLFNRKKINWSGFDETMRKVYFSFRNDSIYREYLHIAAPTLEDDKRILHYLFEEYIFKSEQINQLFEERSIYWLDDIELMQAGVLKTIRSQKEDGDVRIQPLQKDSAADRQFASELFRKTILHSQAYEVEISRKAQNWESERVAKMDMILMKMAICELVEFTQIPVKVTLDEYIELSKAYSSPQSKTFINGILDKIVIEYKRENKIKKTGRGLLEA
ncbi:MAG: transcription antitermination factor NusB [Bacteroidia bacterium]|nr:transcription antitermination factor NusB [Bacteroidia bacterium]